jgi:hypothetical protein
MTPLLYFMAFGWVLALFASLIGLGGWILIKLYRWLTEPPDPPKLTRKSRESWNPNHLKRAGQS